MANVTTKGRLRPQPSSLAAEAVPVAVEVVGVAADDPNRRLAQASHVGTVEIADVWQAGGVVRVAAAVGA
jgi:hypothetical protein